MQSRAVTDKNDRRRDMIIRPLDPNRGDSLSPRNSGSMDDEHAWMREAPSLTSAAEELTIAAYDALADEYDSSCHATTRELEKLSISLLVRLLSNKHGDRQPGNSEFTYLCDIGCGTGIVPEELWSRGLTPSRLTMVDSSHRMLGHAASRIGNMVAETDFVQASVFRKDELPCLPPGAFVTAGLADPYCKRRALLNLRQSFASQGLLFLSVPSRRWALEERSKRIHVSPNRTRFRLRNGSVVVPFSYTYTEDELRALCTEAGFRIIRSGCEMAPGAGRESEGSKPPEVVGVLAAIR